MRRVRVFAGVWNGEIGELIEATHGNTFHRVRLIHNGLILAVYPHEYEFVS